MEALRAWWRSASAKARAWWTPRGRRLRDWLSVLWATRVSLGSVLFGFLLLLGAPQARDLFFEIPYTAAGLRQFWGGFFLLAFLAWAMPVHLGARYILDGGAWLRTHDLLDAGDVAALKRRRRHAITWVPRALGTACFLAIAAGIHTALPDIPVVGGVEEAAAVRGHLIRLMFASLLAAAAFLAFVVWRRAIVGRLAGLAGRVGLGRPPSGAVVGRLYLVAVALLLVAVIALPALDRAMPRALMLPVVLGGWVPVLSFLAELSHRWRVPAIAIAVAVLAVAAAMSPGRHEIAFRDGPRHQLALGEAVKLWQAQCRGEGTGAAAAAANPAAAAPERCHKPVIVIGSGGASRAAFYTASAVGALFDATCASSPGAPCDRYPDMARQIFALSTVSGSSLGAVTIGAALAVGTPEKGPPCEPRRDPDDLWRHKDRPVGWRDCLQMLLAGDYLSPAIGGLVFRDPLPLFWHPANRAAVLEAAWSDRFARLAKPLIRDKRPLLFSDLGPSDERWRPLLLLNGTSAATGRRIMTSHLAVDCGVMRDAYDLYALVDLARGVGRGTACDTAPADGPKADVTPATAAMNSARFPLISPGGAIVRIPAAPANGHGDVVLDRVIDGGYFENFGAVTALELVEALRSDPYGLEPVVLVVTNDPETRTVATEGTILCGGAACPPIPDAEDEVWFEGGSVPLAGLLATRGARGTLAVAELRALLGAGGRCARKPGAATDPGPAEGCPLVEIKFIGEMSAAGRLKDLSMSWWLSRLVQAALDRSMRAQENIAKLQGFCDLSAGDPQTCRRHLAGLVLADP